MARQERKEEYTDIINIALEEMTRDRTERDTVGRRATNIVDTSASVLPVPVVAVGVPERASRLPSWRVLTAYQDFLDMGSGRSLVKLHERYLEMEKDKTGIQPPTTSLGTLRHWSQYYQWELQTKVDEGMLIQARREARRDTVKTIVERQTRAAKILQNVGMSRLQKLIEDIAKGSLDDVTVSEARKFITEGARLERELYGGDPEGLGVWDEQEVVFE